MLSIMQPMQSEVAVKPSAVEAMNGGGERAGGYIAGALVVVGVSLACMLGVIGLLFRPSADPGIRVWMLNHTPDQVAIINPFDGVVEKKFLVADGLKELAFSRDFDKAYIANVVDVSNRITVIDTTTYLEEEIIEVDGVPQGIGVFPDNRKLAVILGSKTDFMAGGFDVIDLYEQSKADPAKKKKLYRERGLALTHKIAVSDDGEKIYCIDAKKPLINIFSLSQKKKIGEVDLHGAPEEMLYPVAGRFYYVSVLQHLAIYQLDKITDQVVAAYIYELPDLERTFANGKLRHMAVGSKGRYLYGTCYEKKSVAIWDVGNPRYRVDWREVPTSDDGRMYRFQVPHYLPITRFRLKGGYNPNLRYTPGGQHLAVDPLDDYLFVVDEDGALYIYELRDVRRAEERLLNAPDPLPVHEPWKLVTDIEGDMRDLKVSRPAVRLAGKTGDGA